MAHIFMEDDNNIIKKCRDYKFCCTYDTESNIRHESVEDAIKAVLTSRKEQSKILGGFITQTNDIMDSLQRLIINLEELAKISDIGLGANQQDVLKAKEELIEKNTSLSKNLVILEKSKKVMDRENIRVPVVGIINSGKSTFLHSALGGGDMDKFKENLFPSGGEHKSCTGTRTVLIYDNRLESIEVVARFKDKITFGRDCIQSIDRIINVLKKLEVAEQFTNLYKLRENISNGLDAIDLLNEYYQSCEFRTLCKVNYKKSDVESIYDFYSFVHFSKNQDYLENEMDAGISNVAFKVSDLKKSWDEGTNYSIQISSDHDFELVKKFVCKYDPSKEQSAKRYTTYCGVQLVEIKGNLCKEIAGLELVDSVGADDGTISNEDQMKVLLQDSDALILLERPQSQMHGGWSIEKYIDFLKKQKKDPKQFLYLLYNCFDNNKKVPSDLSHDLDAAEKYYSKDCKKIYVTDIGEWEEVQSKMLVDMLFNLSENVKETHKECLDLARNARAEISNSILYIRQIAKGLNQICNVEDENASEKKKNIENILKTLFGKVEELTSKTETENETTLRISADNITKNLVENLNLNMDSIDFRVAYEYVSPTGPRYVYNRYVAFLCMYSHMLEDAKRQYNRLKKDINTYVETKRQELLKILWEEGRFQSIMSDLGTKDASVVPSVDKICGWLKQDARELLAEVLEDLLLRDIGVESLIDGSIGKVIEQFDPKNLKVEELFGQELSNPNLENNEDNKACVIVKQLTVKANELKDTLHKSVSGYTNIPSDKLKTEQEHIQKRKNNNHWDFSSSQNDVETSSSDSVELNDNLFDLDRKVRKDVVCDGILKKFRSKMRGEDLLQFTEQPFNELENMYDHYYDVLLSEEEVSHRKRLNELRHNINDLVNRLITLCINEL